MKIYSSLALALLLTLPALADDKQVPNKYNDNTQAAANKILDASLGTVGQKVLVTVSSPGQESKEYSAKIPGDKYSPDGDNVLLSYPEVTKRINEAVDKAKKAKAHQQLP